MFLIIGRSTCTILLKPGQNIEIQGTQKTAIATHPAKMFRLPPENGCNIVGTVLKAQYEWEALHLAFAFLNES